MEQAQELLRQLRQLNIQALYSNQYKKPEEHLDRIDLVKQKIKLLEKKVNEERADIEIKYDGHNSYQLQTEVLPYKVLGELFDLLEISLKELENSLKYGHAMPPVPQFGEFILMTQYKGDVEVRLVTFEVALDFYRKRGKEVKATLDDVNKERPSITKSVISYPMIAVIALLFSLYALDLANIAFIFMPFFVPIAILFAYRAQSDEIEGRKEVLSAMLDVLKNEHQKIKALAAKG